MNYHMVYHKEMHACINYYYFRLNLMCHLAPTCTVFLTKHDHEKHTLSHPAVCLRYGPKKNLFRNKFNNVSNCISSIAPLTRGVPQGLVLSALLCIFYILPLGNTMSMVSSSAVRPMSRATSLPNPSPQPPSTL